MFVTDNSPTKIFVGKIKSLKPSHTTKVTEDTYMWRGDPNTITSLLEKIKRIDREPQGRMTPIQLYTKDPVRIDSVPIGEVWRELSDGFAIYNYSPISFVVYGSVLYSRKLTSELLDIGGFKNDKLKFGLEGGYVFSKRKHLSKILKIYG